jgi:hypothetical protein
MTYLWGLKRREVPDSPYDARNLILVLSVDVGRQIFGNVAGERTRPIVKERSLVGVSSPQLDWGVGIGAFLEARPLA